MTMNEHDGYILSKTSDIPGLEYMSWSLKNLIFIMEVNANINRNKIKLKPLLSTNDKKGSNKEDEQNYTKEFKKVDQTMTLLK